MISLYLNHDSSEGEQWGRDQIYPFIVWFNYINYIFIMAL